MANEYDVVILGGGTGGYVAAIQAAKAGLKVAIVEKEKLGGTCLHNGCIPSKTLLRSAEVYQTVKNASQFGIEVSEPSIHFSSVQHRKETIIDELYKGITYLMKKNKIDVYKGRGRILGPSIFSPTPGTISIEHDDGTENTLLLPKYVIIATGSSPRLIEQIDVDGKYVLTSTEALSLTQLPTSMVIVGGGVIGIEWASLLNDFGVKVTVIEQGPRILLTEDEDIAKEAKKQFEKKGITFIENATLLPNTLEKKRDAVQITIERDGEKITVSAEKMLLSVGRTPNIKDIGLENTSIETKNSAIVVNEFYQTKESHIYAIGDVIGGLQLAHVAMQEAIIAIDHIIGNDPEPLQKERVPKCIYSEPQMASIGLTEEEARKRGFDVKVGTFPFKANGKALIYGKSEGFVKFIIDSGNDDIIGIHLIGPNATEMISEASLAKLVDAANIEIAEAIHPHPSLSEVFGEAALAVYGKAIHI